MALEMERIEEGEGLVTEFKREFTEDIKKTIVAFANTKGGTIIIGINDDKSIRGVKKPDDIMLQVSNTVHSAIKPDVSLFVGCKAEKIQKTVVVAVTVQKGNFSPYYLAGKGLRPEGVFIRQGASTVPASETAIRNMIKETDGDKYEEVRSLNQDLTFNAAKEFFRGKDIPFGINHQKALHLLTIDGVYTNLGLLLSDQSVHTVKLAVFEGIEKEIFKDRKEFSGSLLKQLEDIYDHLTMYNRIHAKVEGLYRYDKRDYPEEALREALLNSLVHRDYGFSSSTLVSVFDDRIEFVSIGGLPKGISLDDLELGISVLRNEYLANIFYRLHLIEAYGTGIPKIIRSYADCARKPVIQAASNAFKVVLPNKNVIRHEAAAKNDSFSENEKKIIDLFKEQNEIHRKEVEEALYVSQAAAVRYLGNLVEKGVIRVTGGGKKTRYVKPKD